VPDGHRALLCKQLFFFFLLQFPKDNFQCFTACQNYRENTSSQRFLTDCNYYRNAFFQLNFNATKKQSSCVKHVKRTSNGIPFENAIVGMKNLEGRSRNKDCKQRQTGNEATKELLKLSTAANKAALFDCYMLISHVP